MIQGLGRALLWLPLLTGAAAPALQEAPAGPLEGITAARLEAHVRFLASDELEGRATGSPGCVRAGEYLAAQLAEAGLEPAGEDGSFHQHVPFGRREHTAVPRLWLGDLELAYGGDFDGVGGLWPTGELELRLVRSAEEVPEPDPGLALFLDGNSREREAWLGGREGWGLVLTPGSKRAGRTADRPPRTQYWTKQSPSPAAWARLRGPVLERVEAGEFATVRLEASVADSEPPAFNVVGRLPGRGELAGEVVVYTAHYDHIGLGHAPPVDPEQADSEAGEPDLINNGADDDASGCAAVIELARALVAEARDSQGPRRTQLFLLVTGEELGLIGTFAYLDDPVEPLERTICNLNFEMIGRPDALVGGVGELWLTGFERTNLGPAWAAEGIEVSPDLRPDMRFFLRSDNIAFARRGIVAQSLSTYDLHTDYHEVTDEADTLDYEHMQACVRTSFEAARALADGRIDPAWEPGGQPEPR